MDLLFSFCLLHGKFSLSFVVDHNYAYLGFGFVVLFIRSCIDNKYSDFECNLIMSYEENLVGDKWYECLNWWPHTSPAPVREGSAIWAKAY